MLRFLFLLGSIIAAGVAILAGSVWLPGLIGDPQALMRWGAGLVLTGGLLLLLLRRGRGPTNRMVVPALLLVGTAVWLVPLLAHRVNRTDRVNHGSVTAPAARPAPPAPRQRAAAIAPPAADEPVDPLARDVRIPADQSGHFFVRGRVNGQWITFLIDTGATQVALSDADARRAGLHPMANEFTHQVSTAHGRAMMAEATLHRIEIGSIEVHDVPALVVDSGLDISLLGMSFLSRLNSYSVQDGVMHLRR